MVNKNINKWVALAESHSIPILQYTIEALRVLCRQEDIPLKEITHVVERDPGLVIHILRTANNRPKGRLNTEITHVNQAFRLMGTNQLTKLPDALPAISEVLDEKSKVRLLATFDRAYHAARFATDWAALNRDMTPDEVFAATQLHFLGEMLIAIHKPELLDKISNLRSEDHISSTEAQYLTLGFSLNDLTLEISKKFKFPALVTETLLSENAKFPRAYGVMLGVQLARNVSYYGWYNQHTLQLQKEVAKWLGVSTNEAIARIHMIAAEAARETPQYNTQPIARSLPLIIKKTEEKIEEEEANICMIPQINVLHEFIKMMTEFSGNEGISKNEFIQQIVAAIHDGIGLNRVVFYLYNHEKHKLQTHSLKGTENEPIFNRFEIKTDGKNIFSLLMAKPQAITITDENREKYWPLVPTEFKKLISTNSFIALSLFMGNKPYALIYADRRSSSCQIEGQSFKFLKILCIKSGKILEKYYNEAS